MLLGHPSDRLLFATDCPWDDAGNAIRNLEALNLPDSLLSKLYWENAIRLLGL